MKCKKEIHLNDISDNWYGKTKNEVFSYTKKMGIVLTEDKYQNEIGNMDMSENSCCGALQDNDALKGYEADCFDHDEADDNGLLFVGYYNCEKCGKKVEVIEC